MTLNEILPGTWRKPLYVAFALVTVALGAIATAFGPNEVPEWHGVATNVVLYVGGAFGLVAGANTVASGRQITGDEPIIEPYDSEDEALDELEDGEDIDELDPSDEAGVPNVHDIAQAEDQAVLDEALLNEVDLTPPPEGYRPAH